MNDAANDRFVPALRRAWQRLEAEAFSELGRDTISGTELRAYLKMSIGARGEKNRSVRAWNRLPEAAKSEALLVAFPERSYARTPPANGFTDAEVPPKRPV